MAAVMVLSLLGAACTSGRSTAKPITPTTTTTVASVTTTTLDPTRTAILSAYRASWADYIAVAESFPVKPLDPRIAQHDTGNELLGDRKALTQLSVLGHYNAGPTVLSPVLTSVSQDSAVITDCIFDHSYEVDARSKNPVEQPDAGHTLYRFEMSRIGSTWYVSNSMLLKSGKTQDACSPAVD